MLKPILTMTSDWHLSPSAWKRADYPSGDSYASLVQIIDFCLDRQTPLAGAGDLFDELKPDALTLSMAFDQISRMQKYAIPVLATQGQHEKSSPPWLTLHPHPTHVSKASFHVNGIHVYGLDHTPFDRLQDEIEKIPDGVDVLMLHQVWKNFMGFGAEGELEWAAARKPKRILTGDYHVHKQLSVDGVPVYSPGSMCMMDISENEQKHFYVLCDDGSVYSQPLKCRKVHRVGIRSEGALEDFLQDLEAMCEVPADWPEVLKKNIISVACSPLVIGAQIRIRKVLNNRAFLFWKPIEETAIEMKFDAAPMIVAPRTREECLREVVGADESLYQDVQALLSADPLAAIQSIENRYMK